ncbi:hypothetical protein P3102_28440 [Amycolatopsis sp. QT-25]|uniref:hypothetical protein n=1 Tax=Amycolatopsis sp. QT-25 TaxID=3034022 RepID=UPI0023EC5EB5|nr:hypothetical protein [Amycolatopsis sp. QT-25]WET77974.1 hypothetical protein P3102_28440 [Amycolatopsis sp. QT-25]
MTEENNRAGAASALAETSAEFGGALGIAVLGSIGAAVYRARIGANAPTGLDPAEPAATEETLGGAVDIAQALPHQTAEALGNVAFDAFIHEMRIAASVSVLVTAGGTPCSAPHAAPTTRPTNPAPGNADHEGTGGGQSNRRRRVRASRARSVRERSWRKA